MNNRNPVYIMVFVVVTSNDDTLHPFILPHDLRLNISPVGWGCRIHRLRLCRGLRPPPNKYPGYETKQYDVHVPVMLDH